jgi:hypothetical protein
VEQLMANVMAAASLEPSGVTAKDLVYFRILQNALTASDSKQEALLKTINARFFEAMAGQYPLREDAAPNWFWIARDVLTEERSLLRIRFESAKDEFARWLQGPGTRQYQK